MAEAAPLPPVAPPTPADVAFVEAEDLDVVEKMEAESKVGRADESELKGWIGGALGALAASLVLGLTAATLGWWLKWMSIGIGFAVAFGVLRLGRGTNKRFGVIGATCAFVGCVISYHIAWCFVLAREQGVPVFEFVRAVESWKDLMVGVMGPSDFAIYAAAMAAG